MSKNFMDKVKLKSLDDLLSEGNEMTNNSISNISLEKLVDFKEHPFKVVEDEDMFELIDSINSIGVIEPIEIRQVGNQYEIISGHRRVYASRKLGLKEIPAHICELNDYDATIRMTASNKYRSKFYPSEKAKSYKMELEAIKEKRKIEKFDINLRSDAILAEAVGESRANVQRYIRLNYLIPEFLELADKEILSVSAAQPLSQLPEKFQLEIYMVWDTNNQPKLSQQALEHLYDIYESKKIFSENDIKIALGILSTNVSVKRKITLNEKKLSMFFDESYSQEDIDEIIEKLLTEWKANASH